MSTNGSILRAGVALMAMVAASGASAQSGDTARIIDEGMNRSQVMLTAHELVDGIGGRMTNSPAMRRAETWALGKFASYGLPIPAARRSASGVDGKSCRPARRCSRRARSL